MIKLHINKLQYDPNPVNNYINITYLSLTVYLKQTYEHICQFKELHYDPNPVNNYFYITYR